MYNKSTHLQQTKIIKIINNNNLIIIKNKDINDYR